jgi:hypothetical protein
MLTFVAHCGANWIYCDGGSGLALVLIVVGVIWAGKRAERKSKERRAAYAAARGISEDQLPRSGTYHRRRRPPA